MSGTFVNAIDPALSRIGHRFQGERGGEAHAVLGSGEFRAELGPADACVESFLAYELDSAAPAPVGGFGKASLGPLLRSHDGDQGVRDAVAGTIAMSYLTWLAIDAGMDTEYEADRGGEQLWDWWISLLRPTVMSRYALPTNFVLACRKEGSDYLMGELDRLGVLPSRFRRRAVVARCDLIAVLGVILRLGQTSEVDDADFAEPQGGDKAITWPFQSGAA